MSVYNGESYVREAIKSILGQTYTDFEFIIIDDGSNDTSSSIIQDFFDKDNRIRCITNKKCLGLTVSLNKGIAVAQGEYIARMDADDISMTRRLEKQVDYLDTHKEVGVIGSQAYIIDDKGEKIGKKNLAQLNIDIKKRMLFNNQCIHSSLMIRKDVLDDVGGYNESFLKSQDYELLFRILSKYSVVNLSEYLLQWRSHAGNISYASRRQQWDAIRARWYAIWRYGFSFLYGSVHILIRSVWYLFPITVQKNLLSLSKK